MVFGCVADGTGSSCERVIVMIKESLILAPFLRSLRSVLDQKSVFNDSIGWWVVGVVTVVVVVVGVVCLAKKRGGA